MGATLVDALDTLIIAGLTDEATEAEEWLGHSLDVNKGQVRATQCTTPPLSSSE